MFCYPSFPNLNKLTPTICRVRGLTLKGFTPQATSSKRTHIRKRIYGRGMRGHWKKEHESTHSTKVSNSGRPTYNGRLYEVEKTSEQTALKNRQEFRLTENEEEALVEDQRPPINHHSKESLQLANEASHIYTSLSLLNTHGKPKG